MNYGKINDWLWLIFLGYWVITWGGNKKTIQRYNPGKRLLGFVALVLCGWFLFHQAGWLRTRLLPDNDTMGLLSTVCCATGVAIAIWARITLGRNWSANPSIKEGHELITRGPYRFARHPIYTGILLALFGSLVIEDGAQVRGVILFAVIAIGLHFKSRVEEGFMLQTFPDSYPEYRRRTKAIIPFVL